MPVAKQTKRVVDDIKPKARPVVYYDSELTGFCVKGHPTGAKRWCVEYRPGPGGRGVGKRRMMWTIGAGALNKIKNYRRIATRYDKTAENFLAAVKLVAVRIWLRNNESTP